MLDVGCWKRLGRFWRSAVARAVMAWALVFYFIGGSHGLSAPLIIDDFAYTNSAAARQAWIAVSAPPVAMATSGNGEPTRS